MNFASWLLPWLRAQGWDSVNSFSSSPLRWSHQLIWSPYDISVYWDLLSVHFALMSGDMNTIVLADEGWWRLSHYGHLTCAVASMSRWGSVIRYFACSTAGFWRQRTIGKSCHCHNVFLHQKCVLEPARYEGRCYSPETWSRNRERKNT